MTSSKNKPADLSDSFVLEGTLTELHTEVGRQNLLSKVLKHYKGQSVVTGIAAAAGDLFGLAANSAMLAMYDGEDTENFVALIDGQPVCGTFGGASKLREGGRIRAIVSRRGDVLIAHALISDEQGYLWITQPRGLQAELVANFKMGGVMAILAIVAAAIFDLIFGKPMGSDGFMKFASMMLVAAPALCLVMALWVTSDVKALSGPATEMFRRLGFENPGKVNLSDYNYQFICRDARLEAREFSPYQFRDVYCYKKAIEDGKIKMAV